MHAHKSAKTSSATTISSTHAFVLPQIVEIASGSEGLVTRVFVRERDEINRGQDVLEIALRRADLGPGDATAGQEVSAATPARTDAAAAAAGWQRVTLKASVTGVVSRCHFKAGDFVRRGRPVLSVLRADDVLVVARFDTAARPRLRRARTAWVHVPRAGAYCMPARIVRIGGAHSPTDPWARPEAGAVRVVAQLSSITFEALSPGMEATVEINSIDDAA